MAKKKAGKRLTGTKKAGGVRREKISSQIRAWPQDDLLFWQNPHGGRGRQKDLLGGKGANLAEMTGIGLPVPPGFTITTEVCDQYYKNGKKLPKSLMDQVTKTD